MTLTKLLAVVGVLGTIGGIVGWFSQQRTIDVLRETDGHMRRQVEKLSTENKEIAKSNVEMSSELARLRQPAPTRAERRPESNAPSASTAVSTVRPTLENVAPKLALEEAAEKKQRQIVDWHRRFDEFFQQRGLSTAQSDRLIELFALQAEAREDLQAAVEKSGSSGDAPGVEKLRSQLYEPITREMREILGNEGYNAYNKYQRTSFFRDSFVDPMLGRFLSANAPLSSDQRERLIDLVAANVHSRRAKPTDIGSVIDIDWETVAEQSRGVLTPAQIVVLRAANPPQKSSR